MRKVIHERRGVYSDSGYMNLCCVGVIQYFWCYLLSIDEYDMLYCGLHEVNSVGSENEPYCKVGIMNIRAWL